MKVAIVGTGNMATGLSEVLASAGHQVVIGSRDEQKAQALAAKVGHNATATSIATAAQSSEVVVLAVPYGALKDTADAAGKLAGKVVIDISNPITADYKDLVVGHTTSAAEELQNHAPHAKVVKAFNTVFAQLLSREARKGKPLQTYVAGNDADAKKLVSTLVESVGFEAVESGPLSNSRFIEPIGEMNIHFGFFLGQGTSVAPAWVTF
ncbi:NADPH-dependent F420 reductase [Burkholderia perseverans]|uniref:NADPH-dependent F420 reductase n=1 Tax=Burkholderia perseverans TaxID=2615214 RepID=UPI001FF00015|nr:NADPH-dependent F420 reductase [Burkholderia perseverans]